MAATDMHGLVEVQEGGGNWYSVVQDRRNWRRAWSQNLYSRAQQRVGPRGEKNV